MSGEGRRMIGDRPVSRHVDRHGNDLEIDWDTLLNPGLIEVRRPAHRRLLEEVGKADEPRVVFEGDAAAMGSPEERGDDDQEGGDTDE